MATVLNLTAEKKYTDAEVAEILGVKKQTPRAWRCLGRGPAYVRVGRCVRYLKSDLDAFLAANRVDPTAVTAE